MARRRHSPDYGNPPEEQLVYQRHYPTISTKDVQSTPIIDFDVLGNLGILDDFHRLTTRVGFKSQFWLIPSQFRAYTELTREFLSSVILYEDEHGRDYIRFLMQGLIREVYLTTLGQWFHFSSPRTAHLGYGPNEDDQEEVGDVQTRETFWYAITRQQLPGISPDPRIRAIIHPVLRIICRSLGFSLFARGESNLRPRHDELKLLATMLRPDHQLERPYLTSLMVHHWLDIQRHGKSGGALTCGSFITVIAHHLNIDLSADHRCPAPITIRLDSLRRYGWVEIHRGPPRRVMWITETEGSFELPFHCPIVFEDVRTWHLRRRTQPQPQQVQGDIPMEEAAPADPPHHSPPQPQHIPPHEVPADWSWPQFYSMMTGMQQVQLETRDSVRRLEGEQERQRQTLLGIDTRVESIDTRMASLEVEFASWGAYHGRGDPGAGPSGPSDPSA